MSKQEIVYNELRERILNGACGPGFRLVIDRIAQEFGVSALPVREAIRRLEAEGLVMFQPNVGAQVSPTDPDQFVEEFRILAVLEGYAAGLACGRLSEDDFAALDAANEQMEQALEALDVIGMSRANKDFHQLIVERCGSAPLKTMLGDIDRRLDAIRRTVFTHIPYRGQGSIEDHREIIEGLRAEDPARAEQAARAHKMRTLEAFEAWQEQHQAEGAVAGAR